MSFNPEWLRLAAKTEQFNPRGLPEFDKARYSDPEYLIQCRFVANRVLLAARDSDNTRKAIEWVRRMGVTHNGRHEGILFEEEIGLILKHGFLYPRPWTSERAAVEVPTKHDSVLGLFNAIPQWAKRGSIVGIATAVCDIFHAGHLLYFRACKEKCRVLVVGIDNNEMARRTRTSERPYNDFPVRAGTISELPEIDKIFRIEITVTGIQSLGSQPYVLTFYAPLPLEDQDLLVNAGGMRQKMAKENRYWYKKIGPNIRFLYTAGDPATNLKKAAARIYGTKAVEIPRYTDLSSTAIGEHFGVQRRANQVDRFGPPPAWMGPYLEISRGNFPGHGNDVAAINNFL